MGYLQNNNEIICIACNVRMFKPTIGKEGGCNPIPLKHAIEGDSIVITARDLDSGARYFSEVIRIKVKDPVTGKDLDNLKAPFKYEYKGRTYYFESEKSMEQFKASPDTYAGDLPPRYYRAQGFVKA
jgi:YHS domain-containing protein